MFDWLKRVLKRVSPRGTFLFGPVRSGITVTPETALTLSACYCAVRVISEAVGSLPIILYRTGDTRTRAREHPLYALLHDAPNSEQTRIVFLEFLQSQILLHGNAFAEIERSEAGRPVALWPIPSTRVRVKRGEQNRLVYMVMDGGQERPMSPDSILHVPALGDGIVGLSPIAQARESIGLTIASERYLGGFYRNAVSPGGFLKAPGPLSDKARENLRTSWNEQYAGVLNAGRTALLEAGLEYSPLQIPAPEKEFILSRQFQITEVARWFNISPVWLHDLGRATWGNLEALQLEFVQTTLRPWLIKWESELQRKLLMPSEQQGYYIEFLVDALLRADLQTRYDSYTKGLAFGMSINEIRSKENLPPIDNGDLHYVPANLIEAGAKPEPIAKEEDGQGNQGDTEPDSTGE